jgi:hypothetical protein
VECHASQIKQGRIDEWTISCQTDNNIRLKFGCSLVASVQDIWETTPKTGNTLDSAELLENIVGWINCGCQHDTLQAGSIL